MRIILLKNGQERRVSIMQKRIKKLSNLFFKKVINIIKVIVLLYTLNQILDATFEFNIIEWVESIFNDGSSYSGS